MIKRGLNPRQLYILEVLSKGDKTATEMGDEYASKVVVSQHADTLVKRGYVKRRPCKQDRRCVYLSLTKAGRELLDS